MSLSTKPASNRKTIGVFASQVGRAWGAEFISGITAAAEANNVNLIHFIGGRLTAQVSTDKPNPSFGLYDLAKPDQFDGLLLTSDTAYGTSPAELKIFSDTFGNLPIVTQSVELQGATMFVPDNSEGMRAVVRHLIEEHGYKRIAFICGIHGQVDAEQRFQAYKDELAAHDLRYDEDLILDGDYTAESGRELLMPLPQQIRSGVTP